MQLFRQLLADLRGRFNLAAATVLLGGLVALGANAFAAVEPKGSLPAGGRYQLYSPYGGAVDSLGNVYVADTNNHRIVKFRKLTHGWDRTAFGKLGQGPGQLYYPRAVAVGDDPTFDRTLVFVADGGNNRIVVFDELGNFVRQFGSYGGGDGQLNAPSGIAVAPSGPVTRVYVADPRNQRIVVFTHDGKWVRSFNCVACPQPLITPDGLAIRNKKRGIELFVVDTNGGRVHVMDGEGAWLRSFGSPGTDPGQLSFPDEIVVDPDGDAWVAESGFGAERISKFDSHGEFQYSFKNSEFIQPHGIALDQQTRELYVVNTGASSVQAFQEKPGKLDARLDGGRGAWINNKAALFDVFYNGVEQSCVARGQGTVVVDPSAPSPDTFNVESKATTIAYQGVTLEMKMTSDEVALLRNAWKNGKVIRVLVTFNARCQDGLRLRKLLDESM